MKNIFAKGDLKEYQKEVQSGEIAAFDSGTVHQVYSTFSIAKDAEWSGRLFVLDMLEDGEEGIGTRISIDHKSPAFVGEKVKFVSSFEEITAKGEVLTSYKAYVGTRLIAEGSQGQRILPKVKIDEIFARILSELD
ncbi:MAG: hypothetical protein E6Q58_03240 [Niabella sp.]|nr:MAG: hypothetical protein E6Q58_03240 [Niabella sp.]